MVQALQAQTNAAIADSRRTICIAGTNRGGASTQIGICGESIAETQHNPVGYWQRTDSCRRGVERRERHQETPDASGKFCHLRFPAIREDILYSDRPTLKDAGSGDIVESMRSAIMIPWEKRSRAHNKRIAAICAIAICIATE
jgi:hypothetical protein